MSLRVLFADLARTGSVAVSMQTGGGFEKYRTDPGGFFRDVLGVKPWEAQLEIADAIGKYDNVTCRSGHGVGKSFIAGGTGLWFIATRPPESLVVLSAPTFKQVQEVLWKETRLRYLKSIRSLGGKCGKKAATGLRWIDGRSLYGLTASEAESFAGIRAPEMLVIVDESSGVKDDIFTAITGNRAGGAKLLLLGNPTKTSGYFHRSHTTDKEFEEPKGKRIHIPSTRSPNVIAGYIVIPGLVTAEWVEARKIEWGEDSPLYKCRVLGMFVELEAGRSFTNEMIFETAKRWNARLVVDVRTGLSKLREEPSGRLVIGLDPSGESGDGDEGVFAPRRGKRVFELVAKLGIKADDYVDVARDIIRKYRKPSDDDVRPLLVVDRDGIVGAKVWAALVGYQSKHEHEFALKGVRGSERAKRKPREVNLVRDEVWLNLVDEVRDGLELPDDPKLQRDLAAIRQEDGPGGRTQIIDKHRLRKELGRSPDRGDAVSLCAYGGERDHYWEFVQKKNAAPKVEDEEAPVLRSPAVDPAPIYNPEPFNPYGGVG